MRSPSLLSIVALTATLIALTGQAPAPAPTSLVADTRPAGQLRGVNLAGGEYGTVQPGSLGVYGTSYVYPTHQEIDYFAGFGMNTIRLPFFWERLQHSQYGELDSVELGRLDDVVNYASSKNVTVILDPHNYARYYGQLIGSAAVGNGAFADFWSRLSGHYANRGDIMFDLMNEPNGLPTEQWLAAANAAIAAIRQRGAYNQILVPGNGFTGGKTWLENWYGTPNGDVMRNVVDPANKFWFDVRTYYDEDGSGTQSECVDANLAASRLQPLVDWLRQYHFKAFIGEFNARLNYSCTQALFNVLAFYDYNSDVLPGWTYWSAGPLVNGIANNVSDIEPENGVDKPQIWYLQPHLPNSH